jgi:hypothetical protein
VTPAVVALCGKSLFTAASLYLGGAGVNRFACAGGRTCAKGRYEHGVEFRKLAQI